MDYPTPVSTNGSSTSEKPVLFFDIDNCLYPSSTRVLNMMGELIDQYMVDHLSLSQADASKLHQQYYKGYGLAIEGLVRHHKIDPLEYNRKVDDALPLEDILRPDPEVRRLLMDVDRSKVRLWLLTNAYVTHGKRVVHLLELEDQFEGITFCDYGAQAEKFVCKPAKEMFQKAMEEAGVKDKKNCYFVDDSALNARGATHYGWNAAHLVEPSMQAPEHKAAAHQISSLHELRDVYPQFFKPSEAKNEET
ncbi:pyrimidine 5-nucleotidase [Aulographum hederae CBS 113979]|uniref:Pyrimidine 5-nucleotidase n=1 Tax=Aulographum hederae CBS 113979 TaxID=1176131 RepID=A0A6G1HH10_9PEZI|nr:pyrimidine 5-nucleotidase [Aulographum hederae CBS 113979]